MRVLATSLCAALLASFVFGVDSDKGKKSAKSVAAPKNGVKTPGVQIPFGSLKHDAEFTADASAGPFLFTDVVWFPTQSKNSLARIDTKTNKLMDPVTGLDKPCSGIASGFGSVWVPNCGNQTLARVDSKTAKVSATVVTGAADVRTGIAADADSVWLLTDTKTTLARIDPLKNVVVSELRLPAGCDSLLNAESALWVSCPAEDKVLRIDPRTNLVANRIEVAAQPTALAAGEGSVWVLCRKLGNVDRIDPKTNKVTKSIEVGVPGAEGNLAFGEGSVWVTLPGFPVSRIDPKSEKVVQQFYGEGGGVLGFGLTSVWLANRQQGTVWRLDPKRIAATLAE